MDVTSAVPDAPAPVTVADAAVETMSMVEAKKIIADRDALKAKVRDLTPLADAGKKALDAAKTTEERLAQITAENATLKATSEKAVAVMHSRLAREIESIPETMRGLVPAGLDAADQLEWIGQAHAAGLFGTKTASPGAQLPGNAGGATIKESEFIALPLGKRQAMRKQVADGKMTVVTG